MHPDLEVMFNKRLDSLNKGQGIDWATAEALAFGTLMLHFRPGDAFDNWDGGGQFSNECIDITFFVLVC